MYYIFLLQALAAVTMIVELLSIRNVKTLIANTMSSDAVRSVRTMKGARAAMRMERDVTGTGTVRNALDAVILMARRKKMMTRTMMVIYPSTICGAITKWPQAMLRVRKQTMVIVAARKIHQLQLLAVKEPPGPQPLPSLHLPHPARPVLAIPHQLHHQAAPAAAATHPTVSVERNDLTHGHDLPNVLLQVGAKHFNFNLFWRVHAFVLFFSLVKKIAVYLFF